MRIPNAIYKRLEPRSLEGSDVEDDANLAYSAGTGQPLEENPHLNYQTRYQTYRRMQRRVPIVASFVAQLARAMNQVTFSFNRSEERARDLLGPLLSPEALSAIATALTHGMSVVNFSFTPDGRIGDWRLIPPETIERYALDSEGNVVGFVQRTTSGLHFIPIAYCVYTKVGSGPRGAGLFLDIADFALRFIRSCDRIELAEQSNLLNKPNVFLDPERSKGKFGKAVRSLLRQKQYDPNNRYMTTSEIYQGETDTGSTIWAQSARRAIIEYPKEVEVPKSDSREFLSYNMSLILGTEFSLLGMNREGSRSLAETQKNTFDAIVRSSMKLCENSIQELLKFLYAVQGFSSVPEIMVDTEPLPEANLQADILVKLQQAGVTLDSPQAQQILKEVLLTTEVMEQPAQPRPQGGNNGVDDDNPARQ